MKEFDDYAVSMKIDFLQENELWTDPGMDMSPVELNNFCNDLLTTHDVSIEDLQKFRDTCVKNYEPIARQFAEADMKLSRVDVEKIQTQLQEAKREAVENVIDHDDVELEEENGSRPEEFKTAGFMHQTVEDTAIHMASVDFTKGSVDLEDMISRACNFSSELLGEDKKLKICAKLFVPASEISGGESLISVLKDYYGHHEVKASFVATGFSFGSKTMANVMLNSDDYSGWTLEYDIGSDYFTMKTEFWLDDMVYKDGVEIVFEIHPVFD